MKIYVLNNESILNDTEFWKLKITNTDKYEANSINLIYYLTGGDSIWKLSKNTIWLIDWIELSNILLSKFNKDITKLLSKCLTLNDLKTKMLNGNIKSELFYEYGLKLNLIKTNI
jgi:hypothetical protein